VISRYFNAAGTDGRKTAAALVADNAGKARDPLVNPHDHRSIIDTDWN